MRNALEPGIHRNTRVIKVRMDVKICKKHQEAPEGINRFKKTSWTEICRSNTILKRHQLIGIGQAKYDQMQYFLRRFLGSGNGPACGLVQVVSKQGSNMQ